MGVEHRIDKQTYLFVLPWGPSTIGGVNQVVHGLARETARAGKWNVAVLVDDWAHAKAHQANEGGYDVVRFRVPGPPRRMQPIIYAKYLATLPRTMVRLTRLLRDMRVDVLNVHYVTMSAFTFALMRHTGLFRGRLILSYHGSDLDDLAGMGTLEKGLIRWMLRTADGVVAVSSQMARMLPWEGAKVIHGAVDAAALRAVAVGRRPFLTLPPGSIILCVANFVEKKGHVGLLRAFGQVAGAYASAHLLLAGRDGPERRYVEQAISELGLTDRVTVALDVAHADIPPLLAAATIFVLASWLEGVPISILEAGAFGIPVVATRVGGISEVIEHGANGLLVDHGDTQGLSDAIGALLDDPAMRVRLGNALQERVGLMFGWPSAYAKYRRLIDGCDDISKTRAVAAVGKPGSRL